MTGYGLIGSDTPIDDLLEQYFPGVPQNLLYEIFENETNALLAALLMEMRGEGFTGEESEAEASYFSAVVEIDGDYSKVAQWDFSASSVQLYNLSKAVTVAFKSPSLDHRDIPVDPDAGHSPAEWSPSTGVKASKMWAKTDDGSTQTVQIVAWD